MPSVFICYSHKDLAALERFDPYMKPLKRRDGIAIWDDRVLEGGEHWPTEIQNAIAGASLGIVFVSQNFLASDFIHAEEWPRLIERHQAKALTIVPVFVGPSTVKADHPILAEIQGTGTSPEKPLSKLASHEQEEVFVRLRGRIDQLLGLANAEVSRSAPPVVRVLDHAASVARRFELEIELRLNGAHVHAAYALPDADAFHRHEVPLSLFVERTAASLKALDSGDAEKINAVTKVAIHAVGPALYKALFPDDATEEKVLRTVFAMPEPSPRPQPWRHPLSIRISGDVPDLARIPWRFLTKDDRVLVRDRWRVGVYGGPGALRAGRTVACTEVLLGARQADLTEFVEPIGSLLASIWRNGGDPPRFVRTASSSQQLRNVIEGQRPQILLLRVPIAKHEGRQCLDFGGGDQYALAALVGLIRDRYGPESAESVLVYLDAPSAQSLDLATEFGEHFAMVVHQRVTRDPSQANRLLTEWLNRWLRSGDEPLEALHEVDTVAVPEAFWSAALSNYRSWRTDPPAVNPRVGLGGFFLVLDREKQKGVVRKWLDDMLDRDTARVMVLVPYGARGNRVEAIQHQLIGHLERSYGSRHPIVHVRLQFPVARGDLVSTLEADLRSQLRADVGEPLAHLLRRQAPKSSGGRAVLWLDWGSFGVGDGFQAPLTFGQVESWVSFVEHAVAQHAPHDLRFVCSVALQLDASRHSEVSQRLSAYARRLKDPKVWLRNLEPLTSVTEDELFSFFKDGYTQCPTNLWDDATTFLYRKSGGVFEELVALVELAEKVGWAAAIAALKRELGGEDDDDDEPLS